MKLAPKASAVELQRLISKWIRQRSVLPSPLLLLSVGDGRKSVISAFPYLLGLPVLLLLGCCSHTPTPCHELGSGHPLATVPSFCLTSPLCIEVPLSDHWARASDISTCFCFTPNTMGWLRSEGAVSQNGGSRMVSSGLFHDGWARPTQCWLCRQEIEKELPNAMHSV